MDMNLQSLSPVCFVSGRPFEDGQRVASFLVRPEPGAVATGEGENAAGAVPSGKKAAGSGGAGASAAGAPPEVLRYDLLESEAAGFAPSGKVICRWVHVFKPRKQADNPERELKLTAESLFLSLADPANAEAAANGGDDSNENAGNTTRMTQVLALMLERKRVLRPKGTSADGRRTIYEHAKSKQVFEIASVTELSPEFFLSIQEQLAALVGGHVRPVTPAPAAEGEQPAAEAASDAPAADAVEPESRA